jgi:hypothetical protein
MDSSSRLASRSCLTRSIYLLLALSSAIVFILALGRVVTVSAYDTQEAMDLASQPGEIARKVNDLSTANATSKSTKKGNVSLGSTFSNISDDLDFDLDDLEFELGYSDQITGEDALENCPSPLAIADHLELESCIQSANMDPGATTLGLAADIVLTSTLPAITSEITLLGNGFFVDGDNSFQLFDIGPEGHFSAFNITIQKGVYTEGGAIRNAGQLYLTDSWVLTNTATTGGGIYNAAGATATVSNTRFLNNIGEFGGGGLYNEGEGAVARISDSLFRGNSSPQHGGGAISNIDSDMLFLTNTHLISNTASVVDGGGAIHNTDFGIVIMVGGSLQDNLASGSNGGAVFNSDVGSSFFMNDVHVFVGYTTLKAHIFP